MVAPWVKTAIEFKSFINLNAWLDTSDNTCQQSVDISQLVRLSERKNKSASGTRLSVCPPDLSYDRFQI